MTRRGKHTENLVIFIIEVSWLFFNGSHFWVTAINTDQKVVKEKRPNLLDAG